MWVVVNTPLPCMPELRTTKRRRGLLFLIAIDLAGSGCKQGAILDHFATWWLLFPPLGGRLLNTGPSGVPQPARPAHAESQLPGAPGAGPRWPLRTGMG